MMKQCNSEIACVTFFPSLKVLQKSYFDPLIFFGGDGGKEMEKIAQFVR